MMVYRRGTVASLTGYETGSLVFMTLVNTTREFKSHTEPEQHKEEVCAVRRSVEIMCFLVDVIRGSLLTLRCFRLFCRLSFTREAMALRVQTLSFFSQLHTRLSQLELLDLIMVSLVMGRRWTRFLPCRWPSWASHQPRICTSAPDVDSVSP